ncbi:MAG TPA: hypothetical protein VFN30_01380 [Chitinophagaceae bacterium]|nr:hypothetical protein [Chitinophagaceae bacterium]
MKTSNKILLGSLVFIMLLFTAIQVGLYAKYKKGEFVTIEQLHEEGYDRHVIAGITKVEVSGLGSLEIIPSDTLRVDIERANAKQSDITYKQKGDVLTINGGLTFINSKGEKEISRSNTSVVIYMPSNISVNFTDCNVRFNGGKDTTHSFSHTIMATNSDVRLGDWRGNEKDLSYFGTIAFMGNGGSIEFLQGASFKELNLTLTDNEMNDQGFNAEKIVLNMDEKSNITLKGSNLKKALNK